MADLGGFFFSILFGALTDKFGVRKFPGVVLGGAAAVAVIRIFATGYWPLWILTFISSALYLPATMIGPKLFSAYFEPKEMGSVMGFYAAGAGLGTTLAFAIAALFPSTRAALTFIAVGMIIIFVAWLFVVKDPNKNAAMNAAEMPKVKLGSVLKSPTMLKVMLCGGLAVGCAILINSYAVTCMIGKGMEPAQASIIATVMNICLFLGGIVSGIVVDKIGKYRMFYTAICIIGGVGYFAIYKFAPIGLPTIIGMGVFAFIVSGSIGLNMGRISLIPLTKEFGPEALGAAGGMNQTAAGLFGWVLPVIVATIFGTNFGGMFTCGAVLFIILGIVNLTIPELGVKGKLAKEAAAGK